MREPVPDVAVQGAAGERDGASDGVNGGDRVAEDQPGDHNGDRHLRGIAGAVSGGGIAEVEEEEEGEGEGELTFMLPATLKVTAVVEWIT